MIIVYFVGDGYCSEYTLNSTSSCSLRDESLIPCPIDNTKYKCVNHSTLCKGYAKTTCEYGIQEKCPHNSEYVKCYNASPKRITCAVGAILCKNTNNQLICYDRCPNDTVPMAVVFDTSRRLAIGLNNASKKMKFAKTNNQISSLADCNTTSKIKNENTTGKENTATIVALGEDYASSDYAPGYCYNLTEGDVEVGTWFLPTARELTKINQNRKIISNAAVITGGEPLLTAADGGSPRYWSSTQYNSSSSVNVGMANFAASGLAYGGYEKTRLEYVRCAIQY